MPTEVTFEYGPAAGERANLGMIKGENIPDRGNGNCKGLRAERCLY